jgi:hypothetical protein
MPIEDDGLNGNPENKTEAWLKSPPSTRYTLPETCPHCKSLLQTEYVYVGVFPYIHTGVHLKCIVHSEHEFTFCFPYTRLNPAGYTVFDSEAIHFYKTDKACPFHPDTKLKPIRLYGDLVFNDGTRKIQLGCPVCCYSQRVTFNKS